MKIIAAAAAVLALASPIAAFAQAPGHVTRTVVTHEETRSGPVVTRTTVSRPAPYRAFHRVVVRHHRFHPIVRKQVVYSHGGRTVTTTTIARR